MASKRDLLQAHQFLAQRAISALVTREPDPEQPPFRRPGGAAIGSIVLAILALVAVGVYGLVKPGGNTTWRDRPAVIVAKETGARYVYLNGVLHPVANYASALLALGERAETVSVSRNSLAGVPRGPEIGIPGAPDALPGPEQLLTGGWSLCSRPVPDPSGSTVDESVLLVGAGAPGGRPAGALLAEVPASGDQYLIADGYRHRIRQADTVTVGLALQSVPRTRTAMAVVDVLPAGEPIAPIRTAGAGGPSTAVPGRADIRAGQLLVLDTAGSREHYLAEADRLRPISPLQYDIQRADPATRQAYGGGQPVGIPLGPAEAAEARIAPAGDAGPGAAPRERPGFVGGDTLCATYEPGAVAPVMHVDPRMPAVAAMATPGRSALGMPMADRVYVEPGRAALIEAMPSAGAYAGTVLLVTDQGRAHALADRAVLGVLGYGEATPVRLPAGIVSRVPLGSTLDPAAVLH
ncbi:type VII secretion protein EccB [Amycolatopsis thermalba]|uniref:Type VII secretion protein EccB n=2 Tax=Amycolatopsis thermalba TaxID=944492 RepID=A0ABY4NXE4_9PSEU|nr:MULTISPECIES: type VII secretion protein EccB [Amycolatopsis]OXM72489.1 type VII secretion protein EccB [Amycolatopsis sp. KNN50.9b]UQS24706.1 type VII secretion protein EccB [Amycolatopsis thermalba]